MPKENRELIVKGAEVSVVVWLSPINFATTYYRASASGTRAVLGLDSQWVALGRYLSVNPRLRGDFRDRYPDVSISFMRTLLADGVFGH